VGIFSEEKTGCFTIIDPYKTQWQIFIGSSPLEVYRASIENEVGYSHKK
jgi:hypothetical protein